jgi:hypothetical protein
MTDKNLKSDLEGLQKWDRIINFNAYPLLDPSSYTFKSLIAKCQDDMKKRGACELPEFVTNAALSLLQRESVVLAEKAFFKPVTGNAYLAPGDPKLPADHPLNLTEDTRVGVVAYDQFPKISLLRRIYEYQPLMNFIGLILKLPEIFPYGDPLGALNLSVMEQDDYLRWHFDQTDFVTSLAIQAGEGGGAFEYVPMIRNPKNENYPDVQSLLKGSRARVVHLENKPGTLVLFQGRYSIHRVTKIEGRRPRYIGLFGYDSTPGVMSTPHLREIRYGRQEALPANPEY